MLKAKVTKVGGSKGVLIPHSVVQMLDLKRNDELGMTVLPVRS